MHTCLISFRLQFNQTAEQNTVAGLVAAAVEFCQRAEMLVHDEVAIGGEATKCIKVGDVYADCESYSAYVEFELGFSECIDHESIIEMMALAMGYCKCSGKLSSVPATGNGNQFGCTGVQGVDALWIED